MGNPKESLGALLSERGPYLINNVVQWSLVNPLNDCSMDPKHLSLAETASVHGASTSPSVNDERQLNEPEVDLVYFDENDPEDPKNWSETKKVSTIAMLCALAFCG